MYLPLSIPSPGASWQAFEFGAWLRSIGVSWFQADFTLRTFAFCILIGIVLALIVTSRRFTSRKAEPGIVLDIALWAVVFGIVGARIFDVIANPTVFFSSPAAALHVLYIWEGGLSILGGILIGALGAYFGCRRHGLRFWSFADALAPALLLAEAFARLGNWFNHELFGNPTSLPWGLQIESSNPAFPRGLPGDTTFLPIFLYALIWDLIGIAVILSLEKKLQLQWGKVLGCTLVWFGIGHTYFESVQVDPGFLILGVRSSVWTAIASIVIGLVLIVIQSRRHPGLEPSVYLPGREWTAPSAVDSGETYPESDGLGTDAEHVPADLPITTLSGKAQQTRSVTSGAGQK